MVYEISKLEQNFAVRMQNSVPVIWIFDCIEKLWTKSAAAAYESELFMFTIEYGWILARFGFSTFFTGYSVSRNWSKIKIWRIYSHAHT